MKIGFVSQPWNRVEPPVQAGSVAILTYETAKRLATSNDVVVFSKRDSDQVAEEVVEGVRYSRIPVKKQRAWDRFLRGLAGGAGVVPRGNRADFSSDVFHRDYILEVASRLQDSRCDVVQIFNFSQFAPVIREADPHVKIVLRMSCEWLTQLDPAIIQPRLDVIDAIFGCSDFITEKIRSAFPRFANRCLTIYNGRDVDLFGAQGGGESEAAFSAEVRDPRLVFVGRISPEKGVHVLVEAFQHVIGRFPNATLDIIGPNAVTPKDFTVSLTMDSKVKALACYYGMDYSSYVRSILPLSMRGRVRFRGPVPHQRLPFEYQTADLFVFPSIWDEPSGNPPIEAMAAGVAVVSTRTGGTPEYVEHGVTGLLVERDDAGQLAAAVLQLLEDGELRRRLGRAGRERAIANFSYERYVKDVTWLYDVLREGRSPCCRMVD